MTRTLDQLVSEAFEDDDLERVASRVRQGKADAHAASLEEAWYGWADEWEPPPLPPGHLRPFAFNSWKGYDGGHLASAWMELVVNPAEAGKLDEQIVRHLTFCHSIALPDPFFRSPDGEFAWRQWFDRESLAAVIETVDRLRELIREDILVVVPMQQPSAPEVTYAVDDSVAELFPTPPPDWFGLSPQQVAALDLGAQIGTADGRLDPYLPTAGHVAVFRLISAAGDAEVRELIGDSSPDPSGAILPQILRCPLPDPTGVTLPDLIAIRRDGYFSDWRNALADGVDRFVRYVGDNPEGWPNADQALRDQIAASVREKASEAQKDIGWTKNRKVDIGVNLVLTGVAASTAFAAPPIAAAIAATGALPTLGGVWARYRFRRGAYARHVALFESG